MMDKEMVKLALVAAILAVSVFVGNAGVMVIAGLVMIYLITPPEDRGCLMFLLIWVALLIAIYM